MFMFLLSFYFGASIRHNHTVHHISPKQYNDLVNVTLFTYGFYICVDMGHSRDKSYVSQNFDLGANRIYFYSNKTSFIYTYQFIAIIPRYISSLGMFELNGVYTYLLESYYVSPIKL